MTDLVLYGSPLSPFVRKVEAVMQIKGLAYGLEPVDVFNMSDAFRQISPLGRIPVLRDRRVGEVGPSGTIPDSSAICAYLEAVAPDPALLPADPFLRGRAVWLEEYADTGLAATGGLGIFRAILFPSKDGAPPPDLNGARGCWREKMPRYLDYMDAELDGRAYFVGEALTLADLSIATQLLQLDLVAGPLPLSGWPGLDRFLARMRDATCFASNLESGRAFVERRLGGPVTLV
ncbi:MAG: glutathione S-transferase family protein [Pseudomonadota bacterium]